MVKLAKVNYSPTTYVCVMLLCTTLLLIVYLLSVRSNKPFSSFHPKSPFVAHPASLNVPITIDTRPTFNPVEQVGVLTSKEGEVLPLLGRKFAENRGGRFEYYTMSGSHGMLSRLPVICNGKNCSGEQGCDQINHEDRVVIGGTNKNYNVLMYDNSPYYR